MLKRSYIRIFNFIMHFTKADSSALETYCRINITLGCEAAGTLRRQFYTRKLVFCVKKLVSQYQSQRQVQLHTSSSHRPSTVFNFSKKKSWRVVLFWKVELTNLFAGHTSVDVTCGLSQFSTSHPFFIQCNKTYYLYLHQLTHASVVKIQPYSLICFIE